jgi:hypothetical protein
MMKQVRRSLTLSALNVFIHHYFSLPWLREYVIDKKVYKFVHYDPKQDKEWDTDNTSEALQSLNEDRLQMYFDLIFLVRTAHERYPTAELFSEIMKHFDALEGNYTLITRKQAFHTPLNSVYFAVAVFHKISVLKGELAALWKKVADHSLASQVEKDCYAEAKAEELIMLGTVTEDEFSEYDLYEHFKSKLVENWIRADCKLRSDVEKRKTSYDFIKYYELLRMEAVNEENHALAGSLDTLISFEHSNLECPNDSRLKAWCLQRISSKKLDPVLSPVTVLWQDVVDLIPRQWSSESYTSQPQIKRARLAFEFEKTLTHIHKREKEFSVLRNNTSCKFENEFRASFSHIPKYFHSHLLELLQKFRRNIHGNSNISLENVTKRIKSFYQIKESLKQFELDWKATLSFLTKAVQARDELFTFYKDCPDLQTVVEDKFNCYYDKLKDQFIKQKNSIQGFPDYTWVVGEKCVWLCYLENFLFRDAFLYHSLSSPSNPVHLEVIILLLQVQEFIADCQHEFEKKNSNILDFTVDGKDQQMKQLFLTELKGQLLENLRFGLQMLRGSDDLSKLKAELILAYLKSCFELLKVQMSYRTNTYSYSLFRPILIKFEGTFLKVQEWLTSNPMNDDDSSSFNEAKDCWSKAFELLRKLPHVGTDYFESLLNWILTQLLAGKIVDPLLVEVFQEQNYQTTIIFFAYFNLLKYFLPVKYITQIDDALEAARVMEREQKGVQTGEQTGTEGTNQRLRYQSRALFLAIFKVVFSPKQQQTVCSGDCTPYIFLLPALVAFQRKQQGLLGEWKWWIDHRDSHANKEQSNNPYRQKLKETFQESDSFFPVTNNDGYYSRLNLLMVCDNLRERSTSNTGQFGQFQFGGGCSLNPTPSTTTEILSKSIELLGKFHQYYNTEEAMSNSLQVAGIYLESVEIDSSYELSVPQKIVELKRLRDQMTKFS